MDSSIRSCLIWASLSGFFVGFLGLAASPLPCSSGAALLGAAEAMQVVAQSRTTPSANDGRRIESGYGDARERVYARSDWCAAGGLA